MKIKNTHIDQLVAVSRKYGSNKDFVLAGGGNTSVKVDGSLFVKASGTSLAQINESGFVRMNMGRLLSLFNDKYPKESDKREAAVLNNLMNAREKGEENKRPSVETLLHGLLPQRFVVHTHPAIVNGLTCAAKGKEWAAQQFQKNALWIPYTDPGYTLAEKVRQLIAERGLAPDILFMENHGLIIAADSVEKVEKLTNYVISKIVKAIGKKIEERKNSNEAKNGSAAQLAPVIRMAILNRATDKTQTIITSESNNLFDDIIANRAAFRQVEKSFTPDHIVYCQSKYCFVPYSKDIHALQDIVFKEINNYYIKYGLTPKIIAIEKIGLFGAGKSLGEALTALELFKDSIKIARYAASFGGVSPMAERAINFIANWEVENYRKKVSIGSGSNLGSRRLNNKIAVVTGGAQGFGLGLSESMLDEGATVVIADRNISLAESVANELSLKYGSGKVKAVEVDVSSDESVKTMVETTLLLFGGIDLFVSNAGVLKAGSLQSLTVSDFELVTKVNYTAFFLCTRHVSAAMKIQNRFAKDYYMDIVQINSKSGLSGSKANFAYAGGKFGGIGLTQSFALELVDYNIKVNAICPGNLFDGPLWSDPQNGLFVQYLRENKVQGAKTVADVKKFYESKVPMKRGCTVQDVAKALLYIVDQQYETGQAIPVTGGQNMLK